MTYIFTSESVSDGHPDKICDQISDALVDSYLARDPHARVAIETAATSHRLILLGEVSSSHPLTIEERGDIARQVVEAIGYDQKNFNPRDLIVQDYIHAQSQDISQSVIKSDTHIGAGDQGLMFGYACHETSVLMPAPIYYAHRLLERLRQWRFENPDMGFGPDAKSQLSLKYEGDMPVSVSALVLSTQHHPDLKPQDIHDRVMPLIQEVFPSSWLTNETVFWINPSGRFVIGGPDGDAGLTGRKIIVDTYGGRAPHGGGAFSGKDPTKVDRSAAYMARYLAKNVVAAGLSKRCTLQLSYAIGVEKPTSIYMDFHGTGVVPAHEVAAWLGKNISLTPYGLITHLDLRRPIYFPTASYGHFGKEPVKGLYPWERLDLAQHLIKEWVS